MVEIAQVELPRPGPIVGLLAEKRESAVEPCAEDRNDRQETREEQNRAIRSLLIVQA